MVWISVLGGLLWSASRFDSQLYSGRLARPLFLTRPTSITPANVWVPVGIGIAGAILSWWSSSGTLQALDKSEVMEGLTRSHILWYSGAVVGAAFAAQRRSAAGILVSLALAIGQAVVGFRLAVGNGLVIILVLFLLGPKPVSLVREHRRVITLAGLIVAALFLWKPIYPFLKSGDFVMLRAALERADLFSTALWRSEPFTTQSILNEVVVAGFSSSGEQFYDLLAKLRVVPLELLPSYNSFHAQFQPVLFPWARAGLAGNPWAEAYALGGWVALCLFLALYLALLRSLSRYLLLGSPPVQVLAAIVGVFVALYFHRNSFVFEINLIVRMVFFWSVACLPQLLTATQALRRRTLRAGQAGPARGPRFES